jgi:surface antigen
MKPITFSRRFVARLGGLGTICALGVALLAPVGAAASTHHGRSHRLHHPARPVNGVGSGSSSSCAKGVCFSGDPFYLYAGQCTWYAAGRRSDLDGIVHGNAGDWLNEARGRAPEGTTPVVGAIAVWLPDTGGAYGAGHVAYVAGVSGGSVTVQDFNWGSPGESYHQHVVSTSSISGYIYGGPAGSGPASPPTPPPAPPPPSSASTNPPAPAAPVSGPASGQVPTEPVSTQPVASSPPPAPTFYVHHVTGTCRDGACGLTLRSGPGYSAYSSQGQISEGAEADVVCQGVGQTVSNGYASSAIWDRLTSGAWVSDFYLDTPNIGTWSPPIPQC